ncbi:MAG: Mth938-like domain-containing protein [Rhodospirillales bacterium]
MQSYGEGRFRIAGETHEGSVLIFAEETVSWPVTAPKDILLASFDALTARKNKSGILIVGCGEKFLPPPADIGQGLREHGIVMEWMDTGAACRTFNVLLGEGRDVTAALVAVP